MIDGDGPQHATSVIIILVEEGAFIIITDHR
jgi:hypothetical protein